MTKKRLLFSLFAFMMLATVAAATLIVPTVMRKPVHAHADDVPCYGQSCNGVLPLGTACENTRSVGPDINLGDFFGTAVTANNVYSSSCNANWTEVTYVSTRAQAMGIALSTAHVNNPSYCSAFPGSDGYGIGCSGQGFYTGSALPIVTDMVDGTGPVQSCIYLNDDLSSSQCLQR